MKIAGLQKFTLLDYPGHISSIIFTQGCNFRCSYCQNSSLIDISKSECFKEDEVLEFLSSRKNMLTGVCITGGEPTIQKDLKEFIKKIKEMGYDIKLDTNGYNPMMLKELIDEKLIDYVAMDIKAPLDDYEDIIKIKINENNIKKSIKIIKESGINHEFRTTIIKKIHTIDKIMKICELVGTKDKLYLQNFELSDDVIDKNLNSFTKEELITIQKLIKEVYPNASIRGI